MGAGATFNTFSQARATMQMGLQLDPMGAWGAIWNRRKVVGVAVTYRRGDYVSIGPVAVHPMMQGRGIGRSLMRHIAESNEDASCLALVQAGTNPHSFTLYRSQGFRVIYPEIGFAGVPAKAIEPTLEVREGSADDADFVLETDRRLAAIDRSPDLSLLLRMGRLFLTDAGYLIGVRMGDALALGPAAAQTPAELRSLLATAMRDLPAGGLTARVPGNGSGFDAFVEAGMVADGVSNLMAAGTWPARTGEHMHPIFPEVL
jgi:GNAT superfamily N-acetyltransferase